MTAHQVVMREQKAQSEDKNQDVNKLKGQKPRNMEGVDGRRPRKPEWSLVSQGTPNLLGI